MVQFSQYISNIWVRQSDGQVIEINEEYTSMTELQHIDPIKNTEQPINFFYLNHPLLFRPPIAVRQIVPYIRIKEKARNDDFETVTKYFVISFIDQNNQLHRSQNGKDEELQIVEEFLNVFGFDFEKEQKNYLNWAFSSAIYEYQNELVQNFQIINRVNEIGKNWFVIQEFMYNLEGEPKMRLISIKLLLTDLELKNQSMYFASLYDSEDNLIIKGTQLFNKENDFCIRMKNLSSHEFQICNETSSNSYKFYSPDCFGLHRPQPNYLLIESKISELLKLIISKEDQQQEQNAKLNQNEVFQTLWNQVYVTANMYPLRDAFEIMSGNLNSDLSSFDIFQPLEFLQGKCLADIMITNCNWFTHQMNFAITQRENKNQGKCQSLIEEFIQDKPEMKELMQSLDLVRAPYDICKDLQDESVVLNCLTTNNTAPVFKMLIDYLFDVQEKSQSVHTILMQIMCYIMEFRGNQMDYVKSYMRFFNDQETYNFAVHIENSKNIMPQYIDKKQNMLQYDFSKHCNMWLRYIGYHKESNDEISFFIQHKLDRGIYKQNVDHTYVDFSLIELHRKIKILKNHQQENFLFKDNHFNSQLDFPLSQFEQEFPQIDKYAISEIAHRYNKFYEQHIEIQQSMKAIIRLMYIQTKLFKQVQFICFCIFFITPFFCILFWQDEKDKKPFTTFQLRTACLIYEIPCLVMVMFQFRKRGSSLKSILDLLLVLIYLAYYILTLNEKEDSNYQNQVNAMTIVILFLTLYQLAKLTEIYHQFQLLQKMFYRCISQSICFVVYLQCWNFFFAITYRLLGMQITKEQMYPNMTEFETYYLKSFQNSMGGIQTPQISHQTLIKGSHWLLVDLIWVFWFLNEFVVTIILLNLLIAILIDAHQYVISHQQIIRYRQEATQNHEFYQFYRWSKSSWKSFILSYKLIPEIEDDQWTGIFDKISNEIKRQIQGYKLQNDQYKEDLKKIIEKQYDIKTQIIVQESVQTKQIDQVKLINEADKLNKKPHFIRISQPGEIVQLQSQIHSKIEILLIQRKTDSKILHDLKNEIQIKTKTLNLKEFEQNDFKQQIKLIQDKLRFAELQVLHHQEQQKTVSFVDQNQEKNFISINEHQKLLDDFKSQKESELQKVLENHVTQMMLQDNESTQIQETYKKLKDKIYKQDSFINQNRDEIEQQKEQYQQEIVDLEQIVKTKDLQIQQMKNDHVVNILKIQETFDSINQIENDENSQDLIMKEQEHQANLQELKFQNEIEMQKLIDKHTSKIKQFEKDFEDQRAKYERMKKKAEQYLQQIKHLTQNQEIQLKNAELEKQEAIEKAKDGQSNEINRLQEQINSFQGSKDGTEKNHSKLKQAHQQEIEKLYGENTLNLLTAQTQHSQDIQEIEQNFNKQFQDLKTQNENQITNLVEIHEVDLLSYYQGQQNEQKENNRLVVQTQKLSSEIIERQDENQTLQDQNKSLKQEITNLQMVKAKFQQKKSVRFASEEKKVGK